MKQTIFIALSVVIIIVIAIFALRNPSATQLVELEGGRDMDAIEQDILEKISDFSSIQIDTSVFNNPAFKALQDYSRSVEPEEMQRINPFAPVNSESAQETEEAAGGNEQVGDELIL